MLTTAQTHPTSVKQLHTPLTIAAALAVCYWSPPMHCTQLAQQCYNGYSKACVVIQHVRIHEISFN